jgi:transcriptional regulator with XRE-family HTH domain
MKRQHGDPRRNYAKEWRHWRKAQGWTQEQMASVLRLTKRTIIGIEMGYHRPNVSSREKLADLQKKYQEAACQPQQ